MFELVKCFVTHYHIYIKEPMRWSGIIIIILCIAHVLSMSHISLYQQSQVIAIPT